MRFTHWCSHSICKTFDEKKCEDERKGTHSNSHGYSDTNRDAGDEKRVEKVYRFQNIFIFFYLQSSFSTWLMVDYWCAFIFLEDLRSFGATGVFGCVLLMYCCLLSPCSVVDFFTHFLSLPIKAFALKLSLHLSSHWFVYICVFMRHNRRLTNISSNMHRSNNKHSKHSLALIHKFISNETIVVVAIRQTVHKSCFLFLSFVFVFNFWATTLFFTHISFVHSLVYIRRRCCRRLEIH